MKKIFFVCSFLILLKPALHAQIEVDLIVVNALIYTYDAKLSEARYMAIHEGRVVSISPDRAGVFSRFTSKKIVDYQGKYIFPGFNDAHCHFYGLGRNLLQVELKGSRSYREVLEKLAAYKKDADAKKTKMKWILGRGWDQNIWAGKAWPTLHELDSMFPKIPVMLKRVDGHAALVNSKALKMAKIKAKSVVKGGEILKDANGKPTGILIDNAVDLVEKVLPEASPAEIETALLEAQRICLMNGLTSVQDAGLDHQVIDKMDALQKAGKLKIRMYPMLNPTEENFKKYMSKGPYLNGRLHIQSVKLYADGSLGSRGACLLEPYSDKPGHYGFLLNDTAYLRRTAARVHAAGYQLNTHCIGDSAARVMLDIYGELLKGKNDLRWRIEHAQVMHQSDMMKMSLYSVIPSVQPKHVSSDKGWAGDRLGSRQSRPYAYKTLLSHTGRIALGTDFPVEDVNPMGTLFSALIRTTKEEFPQGSFFYTERLHVNEALKGMTYWASYAQFEEKEKGCLAAGMFADFVVMDMDITKGIVLDVLKAKVLATYVHGEAVYEAK